MMHDAEDRIEKSGVKLHKAQLLAKLTSVSYCARDNIKAWNCTRYIPLTAYLRMHCGMLCHGDLQCLRSVQLQPARFASCMYDVHQLDHVKREHLRSSVLSNSIAVSEHSCAAQPLKACHLSCRCTSSDSLRKFNITTTVYDITWDLFAFAGYSTAAELGGGAIVVAFRGTDSHSLYNWVENMRYWKTDYDIPYPGSEGALVHTGPTCKNLQA